MSLYLGSGYRCRESVACAFRVFPASGNEAHLDEAARIRAAHETACHFKGIEHAPAAVRARMTWRAVIAYVVVCVLVACGTFAAASR